MQDFEFRVYDFGPAAPSVMLVLTRDAERARALAERTLREAEGCSHVEVWAGSRRLFTVEAPPPPAPAGGSGRPAALWGALRRGGWRLRERGALGAMNPSAGSSR
jgi:hypothetical protein